MLGICYGLQILAESLKGRVEPGLKREYGKGSLEIKDKTCPLFRGLPKAHSGLEFTQRQTHQITDEDLLPLRSLKTPISPRLPISKSIGMGFNFIQKSSIRRAVA
jgi:anthranilate/para-aminobenzoate synthase component II